MNESVRPPCSSVSLAMGESLNATALEGITLWLAIEVRSKWPTRIEMAIWPETVRQWLARVEAQHTKTRILFVRQPRRSGPLRLMAIGNGERTSIRCFEFEEPEQLAGVPVEALTEDAITIPQSIRAVPAPEHLVFVCAHGRRDQCCARYGVHVGSQLQASALRGEVWQCSHLGGHRFAATLVHFPSGSMFGRLRVEQVGQFVDAIHEGRIFSLDRYRGSTRWNRPVQAAESWLRNQQGLYRFDDLKLVNWSELGDEFEASFESADRQTHHVVGYRFVGEADCWASCGADAPSARKGHRIVRHACAMRQD